jgi:hypothetical protein
MTRKKLVREIIEFILLSVGWFALIHCLNNGFGFLVSNALALYYFHMGVAFGERQAADMFPTPLQDEYREQVQSDQGEG